MRLPARFLVLTVAGLLAAGAWTALVAQDKSPGASASSKENRSEEKPYVPKTKRELQRILTPLQFDVTQNEATEPAFRNRYWNNHKDGTYTCVVCGQELFNSKTKYESGTGWPSFYAPIDKDHVGTRKDYRLFYSRIEVHCSRCGAHLGHVFDDGPQPTGLRYCMNSASLKFVEKSDSDDTEKHDSNE